LINSAPDGTNINREAGSEYVRRDRSALLAEIRTHKADLGIAFDGDADRVVFVTPDGTLIDGDHVLGILALQMQAQNGLPGNTVVATDMSNSGLEDYLREHEIALKRTKVGDRYVMEQMRSGGFALGGEQAGHVILLDGNHTVGDGLFIGLGITALAAHQKRAGGLGLDELAAQIPRYPQVIASAQLSRKIELVGAPWLDTVRAQALAAFSGKGRINIRFSGTEPNLLRVMVEGGPANTLRDVAYWARLLCQAVGEAANSPNPSIDLVDCMTGADIANN
jgi:phosphoglucosamine mutase